MKKLFSAILTCALALTLGVSAFAANTVNLTDVNPGCWFYNEVSEMVAAGYIDGYEDGTFRPDQTVTVAEAVTMAARMSGVATGAADGHWAGLQMDHAYRSGWISEDDVPRGSYDTPVTRQLACKVIAAVLGLGYPAGTVLPFTDTDSIGADYLGSVLALYANGLLEGYEDGSLRPTVTLTRAQAATLLYRANHAGDSVQSENTSVITAAGYTPEQIINYFCDVALGAEYGEDFDQVIKWTRPIYYYIGEGGTEEDLLKLRSLISAVSQVPGVPELIEVTDSASANLKINFVDTSGMVETCGSNFNGYVNVWWTMFEINRGEIYYNTDISQSLRNAVIVEEFCQSLGLLTDTYDHPESIFYQYHTDTAWPTTLDWAIIQLLYRSEITPGMDESAVRSAAASLVG